MIEREIPNTEEINSFIHCSLCAQEWKENKLINTKMSPREYQKIQMGNTKLGFQIWCFRHDVNVMHIDLQNFQFPANMTMIPNKNFKAKTEKDLYFEFLDNLKRSGKMNMMGSPMALKECFPELMLKEARVIFQDWAKDKQRHQKH
jgi:hypothetical protein